MSGNLKNQKILLMGYAGRPFAIPIWELPTRNGAFCARPLAGEFVGISITFFWRLKTQEIDALLQDIFGQANEGDIAGLEVRIRLC